MMSCWRAFSHLDLSFCSLVFYHEYAKSWYMHLILSLMVENVLYEFRKSCFGWGDHQRGCNASFLSSHLCNQCVILEDHINHLYLNLFRLQKQIFLHSHSLSFDFDAILSLLYHECLLFKVKALIAKTLPMSSFSAVAKITASVLVFYLRSPYISLRCFYLLFSLVIQKFFL